MKFSKISKRLAACTLAGAMMVSMLGMTAFAEEQASSSRNAAVQFNKVLDMTSADGASVPDVTFSYEIAAGPSAEANIEKNTPEIIAGVVVKDDDGNVIAPFISDVSFPTTDGKLTQPVTVNFSGVTFEKPGIYRYVITEIKRTDDIYENIDYGNVTRYLDVYVENVIDKATNKVTGYTITKSILTENSIIPVQSEDGKSLIYDKGKESKADGYKNAYKTWSLTLDKTLAGTMANYNDKFNFTIEITGVQNGSTVTVNGNPTEGATNKKITITSELGHGDRITIKGIPSNASYKIVEDLTGKAGYTTSIKEKQDNSDKVVTRDDVEITKAMDKANEEVHYTNTKNAVSPTGVALTVAPYLVMVAAAGILAILFLRRRHEEA